MGKRKPEVGMRVRYEPGGFIGTVTSVGDRYFQIRWDSDGSETSIGHDLIGGAWHTGALRPIMEIIPRPAPEKASLWTRAIPGPLAALATAANVPPPAPVDASIPPGDYVSHAQLEREGWVSSKEHEAIKAELEEAYRARHDRGIRMEVADLRGRLDRSQLELSDAMHMNSSLTREISLLRKELRETKDKLARRGRL